MMNKKQTGIFLVLFFVLFFSLSFFHKIPLSDPKNAFLNRLSLDDKKSLENLCECFVKHSSFGYTLFGDKPVSSVLFHSKPHNYFLLKWNIDCQKGPVLRALPIIERAALIKFPEGIGSPFHEHLFQRVTIYNFDKFIVRIEENNEFWEIFLINREAVRKVFQKSKNLFQQFLGKKVTADIFLRDISTKTVSFNELLCKNHTLFGILYGFGESNALLFHQRSEMFDLMCWEGNPPWKDHTEYAIMNDCEKDMLRANREWMKNRFPKPCTIPSLSRSKWKKVFQRYNSLNDKLRHAREHKDKLLFSRLPDFVADMGSKETKKLRKKFQDQSRVIEDIVRSKKILDIVMNKFLLAEDD